MNNPSALAQEEANAKNAEIQAAVDRQNAELQRLSQENQHYGEDDEMDDEFGDLGVEYVDPSLGHVLHLMDLLDCFSAPAPEPRPAPHRS